LGVLPGPRVNFDRVLPLRCADTFLRIGDAKPGDARVNQAPQYGLQPEPAPERFSPRRMKCDQCDSRQDADPRPQQQPPGQHQAEIPDHPHFGLHVRSTAAAF
jgi:hypothetical protein